jgi:hypothetical protein
MLRLPLLAAVLALPLASGARADDLLLADKTIEEAIDHYLDLKIAEGGAAPAAPADDSALLRRTTLDLVGRIPTAGEARSYVASTEKDKRARLVERLLAAPGYARHQATEFDTMMMYGTRGTVREYLLRALAENRPWDQIFRDVLLPDEKDPKKKGAGEFVRLRINDLDKLTTDVSTTFFGVNVSCAKCHDHPLVQDWKQDHFYGMKSFLSRTYDAGGAVGEREVGLVKFKTTKGEERQAKLMFLTGKAIDDASVREPTNDEQKLEKQRLDEAKRNKTPPPPPKFSARAQLVDVALQPDQRDFFARSIVNRLWERFYGLGLVNPVDQMHSENPASHPELLQWLARDLVENGYDLRRLIRGMVLSKAYARSSRWEAPGEAPRPQLFAVAAVRPLTPMQLATSLRLATTDPLSLPEDKPEEFEKRIEALEASARGFANVFEQPRSGFQVGVSEALFFSNSERVLKELLADGGDRLVGRLKQAKDANEAIDLAVRVVLSRTPTAEENKLFAEYVRQRADRPVEAYRQVIWALLTGAEFRFNY